VLSSSEPAPAMAEESIGACHEATWRCHRQQVIDQLFINFNLTSKLINMNHLGVLK
jgi:hypothetical protein